MLVSLVVLFALACSATQTPPASQPAATPIPTAAPTGTPRYVPDPTTAPSPEPTHTPTAVPASTVVPTRVPTPVPSPTLIPTPTPPPTYTPLPTLTPYPTYTPYPTHTPTPTTTPTPVPTATIKPIPTPTSIPTPTPIPTSTPRATSTPVPALGSSNNPYPASTPGEVTFLDKAWAIRVVDVTEDAWPLIEAENRYNDPPEADTQFYMVTLRVDNVGRNKGLFVDKLRTVGQAVGWVYTTFGDSCGVIPNGRSREVLPTFGFEMNICWQVASSDVPSLMMFWEGGYGESDTWFSLENGTTTALPRKTIATAVPTRMPTTATPTPVGSATTDFCSLENFARITARQVSALERGDYAEASKIGIESARWLDRCQ